MHSKILFKIIKKRINCTPNIHKKIVLSAYFYLENQLKKLKCTLPRLKPIVAVKSSQCHVVPIKVILQFSFDISQV